MTEPNPAEPDVQPIGWQVVDPDGNVVDSGPITEAQAAFLIGDGEPEGEQQ